MQVRVRLFASLREAAARPEAPLELPEGATAETAWAALVARHPALGPKRASLTVAVNRAYTGFDTLLRDQDELAFIPPVSGG